MGRGKNPTDLPQFDFDKLPLLLNEAQAAMVLGVSTSYLAESRCIGLKQGRTPGPPFSKIDGKIRYPREGLKNWADSLERRQAI